MPSDQVLAGSRLGDSWVVGEVDSSDADGEDLAPAVPSTRKTGVSRKAAVPAPKLHGKKARSSSAVPEPELIMPSLYGPTMYGSKADGQWESGAPAPPRKRTRAPKSTTSSDQQLGGARAASGVPSVKKKTPTAEGSSDISGYAFQLLGPMAEWLLDILGGTLKVLKTPITWVLAIYIFAGLFTVIQNLLTSSIYSALSPICRIPGSSLLHLPMCQPPSDAPTIDASAAPEFDRLMTVQSQFEEMLAESSASIGLPFDMKRSETSVRDLRQLVTYSSIPSKNELLLEFAGFIETARLASYDLQTFNSHVGRAVDQILSTARWTQRVLDDYTHSPASLPQSPLSQLTSKLLMPFRPLQFTPSLILDQYIKHTAAIATEIDRLLTEAQALLLLLQNLEDRLDLIHGIALRDNIHAQGSKDEVLGQLWTLLGGNRAKLDKFNRQLHLLREVGEQRKLAWAHVAGAILKLQAMDAQIRELRERVGGAQRLRDQPDVPLSVHLESIRMGVDRLEEGRRSAREVESGFVRRAIGEPDDGRAPYGLEGKGG